MGESQNIKHILVTGASGQLGSSIQDMALTYPYMEFVFADSQTLDITDKEKVGHIFENGDFDYCINCAAYTNVEQAEKTPEIAYEVNAKGVQNLAIACNQNKVTLIHISTDYVFDGEKGSPYTVDDIPNPINEYGRSKLKGEEFIAQTLDAYFIVRTSWLYHKNYGKNFYRTILEKAKKGEELQITDREIGCPTNAVHLAEFLLELVDEENPHYGIYHFTDGKAITWFDFALNILEENGLKSNTKITKNNNYRSFVRRPPFSVLKN
jgi:dTDP-4-dehydrorhamnose reductase